MILYNGKCSKISNTFLFLFSNKMLFIRTEIHTMHEMKLSDFGLYCLSRPFLCLKF